MRENCTSSLCGGRRPAQEQSSAPPPTRHSAVGRAGYMGKRSAVVELFLGDMGSMQRELRPSTQREDQLTMETKLEQIAVKAVCRRAWCGESARHVLWEPGAGDRLRRPGLRLASALKSAVCDDGRGLLEGRP